MLNAFILYHVKLKLITSLSLDSELALREVSKLLLLSDSLLASLVLGQTAADSTSLLGAKVKRSVLLGLVEETELITLGLVDDGQDASNGLAGGTTGDKEVSSCGPWVLNEVGKTYIFWRRAPPVIF
jgi:hypothetical protein